MTPLAKLLPLLAALAATPTLAAEADPHAGHHPADVPPAAATQPAAPAPKSDATTSGAMMCPKMSGQTMTGSMTQGQKPDQGATPAPMGKPMAGDQMMDGKPKSCMDKAAGSATGEAKPADPAAPHDH